MSNCKESAEGWGSGCYIFQYMGERDEVEERTVLWVKPRALTYGSHVFLGQETGKMDKFSHDTCKASKVRMKACILDQVYTWTSTTHLQRHRSFCTYNTLWNSGQGCHKHLAKRKAIQRMKKPFILPCIAKQLLLCCGTSRQKVPNFSASIPTTGACCIIRIQSLDHLQARALRWEYLMF